MEHLCANYILLIMLPKNNVMSDATVILMVTFRKFDSLAYIVLGLNLIIREYDIVRFGLTKKIKADRPCRACDLHINTPSGKGS